MILGPFVVLLLAFVVYLFNRLHRFLYLIQDGILVCNIELDGFYGSEDSSSDAGSSPNFEIATLSCIEAQLYIEELGGLQFLLQNAKYISYTSFKVLVECKFLDQIPEFYSDFRQWSPVKQHYPEIFEESTRNLDLNGLTSLALDFFPISNLLDKLLDQNVTSNLLNKLPFKKIINFLRYQKEEDSVVYFRYWKIIDEAFFSHLEASEQKFCMNFLLKAKETVLATSQNKEEDILIWFMQIENIIISLIIKIGSPDFSQLDLDPRIELYSHIEGLFMSLLKKKNSNLLDVDKVLTFPSSNRLKQAIRAARKAPKGKFSCSLRSGLTLQKPFDVYANYYYNPEESRTIDNLLKELLASNLDDFVDDESINHFPEILGKYPTIYGKPHVFLEALKFFSTSEKEVIFHFNVVHSAKVVDAAASYTIPFKDWIRMAFEMSAEGAAALLNLIFKFYPKNTALLIRLVGRFKHLAAKDDLKAIFWAVESDSLRFGLLIPPNRSLFSSVNEEPEIELQVDFVDVSEVSFRKLNTFELAAIFPNQYLNSPIVKTKQFIDRLSRHKESAHAKIYNNDKIKRILKDSLNFFETHTGYLKSSPLKVHFDDMPGVDNGGLSRHFLTVLLTVLLDEEFNLFHGGEASVLVHPRSLLEPRILSFLGILHCQALKFGLKVPWIPSFDIETHPKRIQRVILDLYCDEEQENSKICHLPKLDSVISRISYWRVFSENSRLIFANLSTVFISTPEEFDEYFKKLQTVELAFWNEGFKAYKNELLGGLDHSISSDPTTSTELLQIVSKLLQPLDTSKIQIDEFMNHLIFTGTAVDRAHEAIFKCLSDSPVSLIPDLLKFATGSNTIPSGGLASLHLTVVTKFSYGREKRLPQASTCTNSINWDLSIHLDLQGLSDQFSMAIRETNEFLMR